jgi:hypothetical protein
VDVTSRRIQYYEEHVTTIENCVDYMHTWSTRNTTEKCHNRKSVALQYYEDSSSTSFVTSYHKNNTTRHTVYAEGKKSIPLLCWTSTVLGKREECIIVLPGTMRVQRPNVPQQHQSNAIILKGLGTPTSLLEAYGTLELQKVGLPPTSDPLSSETTRNVR